jgi:hypothetical protein
MAISNVRRTTNAREVTLRASTHKERTRTGEVAKGGSATFQKPTAQDALVDMEVVGCSIFARRLTNTVLSRYPVAV